MLRELVANNVFVFTSEMYAQVTSGAILTSEGAIVVDTMPYPKETRSAIKFVEGRHQAPIKYVINTHYHADHTYGTCLFKQATVVSHARCREILSGPGRASLERAKRKSRDLSSLQVRLPDEVFDEGRYTITLGDTTVEMWHTPGHSDDSIVAKVVGDNILFAADTVMPVPFFADGSWQEFVNSLEGLLDEPIDLIVQGHGEVILRGEVQERLEADLAYLRTLRERVVAIYESGGTAEDAYQTVDIEECGKSRITLNGLAVQLHQGNIRKLFDELAAEKHGQKEQQAS